MGKETGKCRPAIAAAAPSPESDIAKVMLTESTELRAAMTRPAFREAVNAFIEKRQPEFHKGS